MRKLLLLAGLFTLLAGALMGCATKTPGAWKGSHKKSEYVPRFKPTWHKDVMWGRASLVNLNEGKARLTE